MVACRDQGPDRPTFLFEWNSIIPLEVSKVCAKESSDSSWNPKCIEQARVHLDASTVNQVSVMLVAAGHSDEICKNAYNANMIKFGSVDVLAKYSFRKPVETLQCAFVDFTEFLHNFLNNWKVTMGILRPIVVIEPKEEKMVKIWKSAPFITIMGPKE